MNKLVVYYSLEGNTKFIGDTIAKTIDADVLEVKPKKEIKGKGFMKYFWGGRQVVSNMKPELESIDINIEKYDVVIIGTPVWAWTFAPAIKSFIDCVSIANKKIAFFCCHNSDPAKTFNNLKKALPFNTFIGEVDFNEPLKNSKVDSEIKAQKWASELIPALEK